MNQMLWPVSDRAATCKTQSSTILTI